MMFDKEKLLAVFDETVKTGTDPVRTRSGRLSVASELVPTRADVLVTPRVETVAPAANMTPARSGRRKRPAYTPKPGEPG